MNRREFVAAVTAGLGVAVSSPPSSDSSRNWYLVEEYRAGEQDSEHYIVPVDADLDLREQWQEALIEAGHRDRQRYPNAARPDMIQATVKKQL